MALRPTTHLDVCAGGGMLGVGLSIAIPGLRTVGYVEREAYAASLLVARMEDQALDLAPIWSDLETFEGAAWRGLVDIISAGLPCQPYSTAGKRKGDDDERAIWPEFTRIVAEVRPAMVFLENVPAFVTGGHFRRPGEELSRLGYRVEAPLFIRASSVGASHRRERVFILAHAANDNRRPGERFGEGRETEGRSEQPVECGGDLADAEHRTGCTKYVTQPGWGEGFGERDESEPRRDGKGLADAGQFNRSLQSGRGPQPCRQDPAQLAKHGAEVADPACERSEVLGLPIRPRRPHEAEGDVDGAGLFAPGPNDPAWPQILAERPDLEPAVCRVADGLAAVLAHRNDALRVAGNGVVALQAAVAFATLAQRVTRSTDSND